MGKTSYEVRKRYEDKVYSMISARIPKEIAERFRTVTAERGDSQAAIIKEAIANYLITTPTILPRCRRQFCGRWFR